MQRWSAPAANLPAAVPFAIALAWAALVAAQATGHAALLHGHAHDQAHGPTWLLVLMPPFWLAAAGFVAAWLVMVAAMMLPANVAAIRRVSAVVTDRPRLATGAFLVGHAVIWAAFGVVAYLADVATHPRPALALPALVAAAGVFQFTTLKRTCLSHRRPLEPHLQQPAGSHPANAFRLGRNHGLACVGCCGPLMLLMLAAPGAPLLWMAGLTALMVCESTPTLAPRATPAIGAGLLLAALLMLALA